MRVGEASPNYQVIIYNRIEGVLRSDDDSLPDRVILAHAPESIQINFQSTWTAPFTRIFNNAVAQIGGQLVEAGIPGMTGIAIGDQALTALMWAGTQPPLFRLALEFYAEDDPKSDVAGSVADLCKLVLPTQISHSVIATPGPNIFERVAQRISQTVSPDGIGSGFQTSVLYGGRIFFDDVVFESVNILIPARFDADGYAVYAKVDVTFRSFVTPFAGDIDQMFNVKTQG